MADESKKRAGIYVAVSFCRGPGGTVSALPRAVYGPDEKPAEDAALGAIARERPPKNGYSHHEHWLWLRIDDDLIRQAARALEAEHGVSPVPIDDQIGRLSVVPEKDKS